MLAGYNFQFLGRKKCWSIVTILKDLNQKFRNKSTFCREYSYNFEQKYDYDLQDAIILGPIVGSAAGNVIQSI